MKGTVALKCETPSGRRYVRRLSADARSLQKLLLLGSCELSLVLTGDAAIRELNRLFRGKDRPTDVLSFPQHEGRFADGTDPAEHCDGIPSPLGDVVISVDTALRQAQQLGVTAESRLRTLLIHGVLHLLGYDHERSRADARHMFAQERELAGALESTAAGLSRSSLRANSRSSRPLRKQQPCR